MNDLKREFGKAGRWKQLPALLALGLVFGTTACASDTPAPAPVMSAPPAAVAPVVPAAPVARSTPVRLRVAAIKLDVPLIELGINADHTVEVPSDYKQAGWYRLGPAPGENGSAVVLGHVDSYLGPGVFFELSKMKAGDTVDVDLADGTATHFAVTSVATYPKDQFPTERVYAPHGGSKLQLVTCGGEFDTASRNYLSNVVVYTSLVSTSKA